MNSYKMSRFLSHLKHLESQLQCYVSRDCWKRRTKINIQQHSYNRIVFRDKNCIVYKRVQNYKNLLKRFSSMVAENCQ
jgi:hypothetical protein